MKVLLVEDSARLQRSISSGLKKVGIAVDQAYDGDEALGFIDTMEYDVIVLDLMLPKRNGLEVLAYLRKRKNMTHVLILSAKSAVADRIEGLNLGADDYLTKPFLFDELLARINALVRRGVKDKDPIVRVEDIEIDTSSFKVTMHDEIVALTPTEYQILLYLAQHQGNPVTHENLIFKIYDSQSEVNRNSIEAHISVLRKKLRENGIVDLIKTRRGFGYIIEK